MLAIADKSEKLHVLNPVIFSKLIVHELKKYADNVFSVTNTIRKSAILDQIPRIFTRRKEQESKESLAKNQITFRAFADWQPMSWLEA